MADNPIVGLCTLELHLPGLTSLKEKRGILKSMLAKLHNTFNVSAAEVWHLDKWQMAGVAVVCVSNSTPFIHELLDKVLTYVETHYPEAIIVKQRIEIL